MRSTMSSVSLPSRRLRLALLGRLYRRPAQRLARGFDPAAQLIKQRRFALRRCCCCGAFGRGTGEPSFGCGAAA
jgi:hypothetical protein